MKKQIFKIVFQAEQQSVDVNARLKRLLKVALRSFGFQCLRVEPVVSKSNSHSNWQEHSHLESEYESESRETNSHKFSDETSARNGSEGSKRYSNFPSKERKTELKR